MENKRIVVKIGTSTLAHPSGLLNIRRVEELCRVLSDLKNAGHEIILVSSGAIGMGAGKLSLPHRPEDTPTKQAAAAVGQCELMYTYDKAFAEYNHTVAQILLTAADVDHPDRFQNFHNTMRRLLDLKALAHHQRKRHGGHRGNGDRGQRHPGRRGGREHGGRSADPAVRY